VINYAQLSALCTQVHGLSISEGALAKLFQPVKPHPDHRVGEILTHLRSSRLICSDETGARINGRSQ
jgi:transposase